MQCFSQKLECANMNGVQKGSLYVQKSQDPDQEHDRFTLLNVSTCNSVYKLINSSNGS